MGAAIGGLALAVTLAACSGTTSTDTTAPATEATTTQAPTTTNARVTATSIATTSTTIAPTEVAAAFVASVGSSIQPAIDLVAPGAAVDLAGADSYEDLEGWLEWNVALGWSQTDVDCGNAGASIVCEYTYSNPWMEQADVAPHRGSTYTLQVGDGKIMSIDEDLAFDAFSPLWDDFKAWITTEHPDAGILNGDEPILTDEALAQWHELSAEFTERLLLLEAGNAYVDALLSLDPDELDRVAGGDPNLYEDKYLQAWLKALHYRLDARSCDVTRGRLNCALEGIDDLGEALGVSYVDGFAISVSGERIVRIVWSTSADPQDVFDDFQDWLRREQPELFAQSGACEGFFQRGPTPEECALAWLAAAPAFVEAAS